ncbi:MAG: DUF975 family protein [Oscillibacter sp.]|nr:DUF975 family protein [Oscillibacter sp.]
MINRAEIKYEAKNILRTARVSPYIVTLLMLGIGYALDRAVDLVQNGSLLYSYELRRQYLTVMMSGDADAMARLLASIPEDTAMSFFFSILVMLVTLVLSGGFYIYCMGVRKGAEMPYSTLADGLSVAGKLIWCEIQMAVKVFLWSMLFFIPGIVALYRYRFAIYNVLTDDSISAGEAIRRSCRQTSGMKWQLFVLDLSFLGWNILANMTFGLLNIWLTPYRTMCDLAYYESVQENFM